MADSPEDLLAIEKRFWTGDETWYRENVDRSCLVAFTEMAGVMGNGDIAATAGEGKRWRRLQIEPRGFLQPSADVAMLTYEANAERADGQPYRALVSTGYIRRAEAWKMMFHAQTPLVEEKAPADG